MKVELAVLIVRTVSVDVKQHLKMKKKKKIIARSSPRERKMGGVGRRQG